MDNSKKLTKKATLGKKKIHFFRSVPMSKCEMILYKESAFDCMLELGTIGKVQLMAGKSIAEGDNELFTVDINRCNGVLNIISFMEAQIQELNMDVVFHPNVDNDYVPTPADLGVYERDLLRADTDLKEIIYNIEELKRQKHHCEEKSKVLEEAQTFLRGEKISEATIAYSDSIIKELVNNEVGSPTVGQKIGFYLGTIGTERFSSFELMAYRVCRGNYFMKNSQIVINSKRRTVFLICFMGKSVSDRILKICLGFHVKLFDCPETTEERMQEKKNVDETAKDLAMILEKSETHRQSLLSIVATDIYVWKYNTKKMMMIYVELNKMTLLQSKYLHSLCWIPTENVEEVRSALARGAMRASKAESIVQVFPPFMTVKRKNPNESPPTHFNLNQFTYGFQSLINAYGLANYRELNPAPYTVITFPFLFAVMFGDVGHGFIMAIFALFLIKKNKKFVELQYLKQTPSEILTIIYGGRYIIFLMGVFSMYTGIIYNDIFSKSLNIFGSHWYVDKDALNKQTYDLNPQSSKNYRGDAYIFGLDPIWKISGDTAIVTFNSVKMKLAIILGVVHMIFGLTLSIVNNVYSKNYIDLVLINLPQIIIFSSLFLYLIILIFIKWVSFGGHNTPPYNTACAPSILITFIDMVLMKNSAKTPQGCRDTMYDNQPIVQYCLLCSAVICLPILLAGKPIYFHIQQRRIKRIKDTLRKQRMSESTVVNVRKSLIYQIEYGATTSNYALTTSDVAEVDMMEVWIHSGIHTIDSVLGAVSHTASYLRLWALSLAHEQLSHVLWSMVMRKGFGNMFYHSAIVFFTFAVWAALTLAILVTMEALSAFLHTLRLHWVEFQSKFYEGAGEPFFPFFFKRPSKYF